MKDIGNPSAVRSCHWYLKLSELLHWINRDPYQYQYIVKTVTKPINYLLEAYRYASI